jgi:hypothetical protein
MKKEIRELEEELNNFKIDEGFESIKGSILEKIKKLKKSKKEASEKKEDILNIKKEIEILKLALKDSNSSTHNELLWGGPNLSTQKIEELKSQEESNTIKLYKNMFNYRKSKELFNKYLEANDYNEKINYAYQLGELGFISNLKYICSKINEGITKEYKEKIESIFRAQLMLNLWNDNIDKNSINNFIHNLNDKSQRKIITDQEYFFTYQIASSYCLTTKIIQPEFKPKDIIFLFFQFKEDNEYYIGPICEEDNIISSINMTEMFKEVENTIKEHNLNSMKEISVICSQKIYEAIFKEYS